MSNNQQLTPVEEFKGILSSPDVQKGFGAVLPKDVDQAAFTAVVVRAIQEDPDILNADRKSLFLACQDAAKDGLMPDKREGALVIRGKAVTWQPMIAGVRKNAARAGFDIRAEVVCENDIFDQELGDEPTINHKRPPLSEPRGKVIGAYAIAKNLITGEKYREVMTLAELESIRKIAKTDYIWKAHTNEMYRKTVARRVVKYLPITGDMDATRLYEMMERDNQNFTGSEPAGPTEAAKEVQEQVRKPTEAVKSTKTALPKVNTAPKVVTDTKPPPEAVKPAQEDTGGDPGPTPPDDDSEDDVDAGDPGF